MRLLLTLFIWFALVCPAHAWWLTKSQVVAEEAADWTADASIRALYSFESGAQADDSTTNNNDLTCNNDPTCPTADTTNYEELSQSAVFTPAGTDRVYHINQTDIASNFPANGTTTSAATIGTWVRITTLADFDFLFAINKSDTSYVFAVSENGTGGQLRARLDAASGATTHDSTATLSVNTWYFIAIVYDGSNLSLYIRESGSGSSEFNSTSASLGNIDDMTSGGEFAIGGKNDSGSSGDAFYGNIDGLAVFERAFTQSELDSVFTNGWDGDGW